MTYSLEIFDYVTHHIFCSEAYATRGACVWISHCRSLMICLIFIVGSTAPSFLSGRFSQELTSCVGTKNQNSKDKRVKFAECMH